MHLTSPYKISWNKEHMAILDKYHLVVEAWYEALKAIDASVNCSAWEENDVQDVILGFVLAKGVPEADCFNLRNALYY